MSMTNSSIKEENVATLLPQVGLNGQPLSKGEIDDKVTVIDTDDEETISKLIEEMMEIEDYDDIVTEATITEQEDIYYNRTKYENGDINICFITGYSGGGKSTLSKSEKRILRDVVDMDRVILCTNKPDEYYKNMGKFVDAFMNNGPGKKYREEVGKDVGVKNISDKYRKAISKDMVKFAKSYAREHKSSKLVLEGVWIYRYIEPNEADNCAVYIKGTSLKTSTARAIKRDNDSSRSEGKGNAITRVGHAAVKTFMASKDFLFRHLEKWQKYFAAKYEKQKHDEDQISTTKQVKNEAKGIIHDAAGFIKKITESEIDIMNTELVCESFEDSIINKVITGSKIGFKTRKLISKIYSLKIKIAELELNDVDEESNKKLIDMKKDYVKKKQELLTIKKSSDKELKKAINDLEKRAKEEADVAISELEKKKEENEEVKEGVTYNEMTDLYFTEMNHISGTISNITTDIKEKLHNKSIDMVKKDEVIKNVEDGARIIKDFETQFENAKKVFETVYNKYKGTKIGEKTFGDLVTFEPICKDLGFVATYLKIKNSYTYCQTDCLIDFVCDSEEKCDIVTFTSILHTVRKILAEVQKQNPNKLAVFKVTADKEGKMKEIKLMLMIRATIGKMKTEVKESVDVTLEAAKDRDGDGKLEVSPELKRLDEKRGRLADLKKSLGEAQDRYDATGEKIYENKIKGLTAKIDKLTEELKEGDKKLAAEERQQSNSKIKEDKSVTESYNDLIEFITEAGDAHTAKSAYFIKTSKSYDKLNELVKKVKSGDTDDEDKIFIAQEALAVVDTLIAEANKIPDDDLLDSLMEIRFYLNWLKKIFKWILGSIVANIFGYAVVNMSTTNGRIQRSVVLNSLRKVQSQLNKELVKATKAIEAKEKDKAMKESVDDTFEEAANMEDEIKPIVAKFNEKGYKVKYASPGHSKLRKKEDKEPDGIYYGKLYSDARVMFDKKYDFPDPPKGWHWREVDGCSYLDITPKAFDEGGNKTPDEAFDEWKSEYMRSLSSYANDLPNNKKNEETKESVDKFSESVTNSIYEALGMDLYEPIGAVVNESVEVNSTNTLLKELDKLLS